MLTTVLIIVAVLMILGMVGLLAFAFIGGGGDSATKERLDKFVTGEEEKPKKKKEKKQSALVKSLDEAVAERGMARNIATNLARADLKVTVGEYIVLVAVSILATGLIAFIIFHRSLLLALVGLVAGFFLPSIYVGFRKGQRLKKFNDQLGDSIGLLANGLRSGYSMLQAMEAVSHEMPSPVADEFSRVVREISLGVPMERAMNNLLRRVPSDDLDLMITAINVQHEVGGNLSEILETIGHTIRERVRIKGEIAVLTAQGTITGYIISFLPVALGLILYLINPTYIGRLFEDPCGWAMLGVGVLLIGIGAFAIKKIVTIEV